MSKYIDQDGVLKYIIYGVVGKDVTCGELKGAIESLPTIEIVKCEDCRHNNRETIDEIEENWCEIFKDNVASDDFCSYGEKQIANKKSNTITHDFVCIAEQVWRQGMIRCTNVGIEPSYDCYDICVSARRCEALKAWEREKEVEESEEKGK